MPDLEAVGAFIDESPRSKRLSIETEQLNRKGFRSEWIVSFFS
jgi:hypothetical protein